VSRSPRISIILPFLDAAPTLPAALASIRDQSYQDWELIAYDDGSTDDSRALVESFANEDRRVRVMGTSHVGIVQAPLEACAQANGSFLARMDADDVALPLRLEKQVGLLTTDPDIALCGTQVKMHGASVGSGRRRYEAWLNGLVTHEDIVREIFVECPIAHPTLMMRREAYLAVGGYEDHAWPEDYDLIVRCWRKGFRLANVPEELLEWHDTPSRLSMRDTRYDETAFRALKRHYLFSSYLKEDKRFYQWGAGEVGKRWLREWGRVGPEAVVDINPRKIGTKIHGFPIIAPEELPPSGDVFVVVAVGAPGARDVIRAWFTGVRYEEGLHYVFIA
jgi:glycosyltransferase involved in cell wall biosynthesis